MEKSQRSSEGLLYLALFVFVHYLDMVIWPHCISDQGSSRGVSLKSWVVVIGPNDR